MTLKTKSKTHPIYIPLTVEQIAIGLKQLSEDELDTLDLMLDEELIDEILRRGKIAEKELKKGKTLSLGEMKKELGI